MRQDALSHKKITFDNPMNKVCHKNEPIQQHMFQSSNSILSKITLDGIHYYLSINLLCFINIQRHYQQFTKQDPDSSINISRFSVLFCLCASKKVSHNAQWSKFRIYHSFYYIMVQRIGYTLVVLLGKSYFIRRQKCS